VICESDLVCKSGGRWGWAESLLLASPSPGSSSSDSAGEKRGEEGSSKTSSSDMERCLRMGLVVGLEDEDGGCWRRDWVGGEVPGELWA
jgi:hypothetical protein